MGMQSPINVHLFMRKPQEGVYSIERVFANILPHFSKRFKVTVHEMPYGEGSLLGVLRNGLYARKHQGDINHIGGAIHYIVLFLKRKKTVLTIHDCVVLDYRKGLRRWIIFFLWYYLPIKFAGVVTFISNESLGNMEQVMSVPRHKTRIVYDPTSIEPKEAPEAFSREGLPVVIMLGTKQNKNLERSFAALKGLALRVILIGRLTDEQRAMIEESGLEVDNRVHISDEEIVEAYVEADFLLFASLAEGFGMPILEAQALGRPVVTSNCSSMPEVAGDAALLVDPYSEDAIRTGIERILNDPELRAELIQKGRDNIGRFSPQKIAGDYEALYDEQLSGT